MRMRTILRGVARKLAAGSTGKGGYDSQHMQASIERKFTALEEQCTCRPRTCLQESICSPRFATKVYYYSNTILEQLLTICELPMSHDNILVLHNHVGS